MQQPDTVGLSYNEKQSKYNTIILPYHPVLSRLELSQRFLITVIQTFIWHRPTAVWVFVITSESGDTLL